MDAGIWCRLRYRGGVLDALARSWRRFHPGFGALHKTEFQSTILLGAGMERNGWRLIQVADQGNTMVQIVTCENRGNNFNGLVTDEYHKVYIVSPRSKENKSRIRRYIMVMNK